MLHRIRLAMQTGSFDKLGGEVEVDETYIGGKAIHTADRKRRIPSGKGMDNKTAVLGMVERGGKVRAEVMFDNKGRTLIARVRDAVELGATIYTDALQSPYGLSHDFEHQVIDHAEAYVDGRVHANGMESFWSLLKRRLAGTCVSVAPFHLFRYLDRLPAVRGGRRRLGRSSPDVGRGYRSALAVGGAEGCCTSRFHGFT